MKFLNYINLGRMMLNVPCNPNFHNMEGTVGEKSDDVSLRMGRGHHGRTTINASFSMNRTGQAQARSWLEFNLRSDLEVEPGNRASALGFLTEIISARIEQEANGMPRVHNALMTLLFRAVELRSNAIAELMRARKDGEDLILDPFTPKTYAFNVDGDDTEPLFRYARGDVARQISINNDEFTALKSGFARYQKYLIRTKKGRVETDLQLQLLEHNDTQVLLIGNPVVYCVEQHEIDGVMQHYAIVQNPEHAFIVVLYGKHLEHLFNLAALNAEMFRKDFESNFQDHAKVLPTIKSGGIREQVRGLKATFGETASASLTIRQRRAIEAHKAKTEAAAAAPAADASPAEAPKAPKPRKPRPSKAPPADPVAAADAGVSESPADSSAPN